MPNLTIDDTIVVLGPTGSLITQGGGTTIVLFSGTNLVVSDLVAQLNLRVVDAYVDNGGST